MNRPPVDPPASLSTLLLTAACLGMASGIIEVLALLGKRTLTGQMLFRSRYVVWTAPLAITTVCLLAAIAVFLACRLVPRLNARWWTIFAASSLAAWNPLMMLPGVHHVASLLLSAGIGVRVASIGTKHRDSFQAVTRRIGVAAMSLVVVLAGLNHGADWWQRQRAAAQLPVADADAPNVMLIVLDTVRARSMSLYGYELETSPKLQEWARSGVVFERAISTAPWTLTSHASMFTGRFPGEVSADWADPLDEEHPTLAELLASRGYETRGIVANLGYTSYETGLDRGFLHYEDYTLSLGQLASDSTLVKAIADNFRLRRLIRNDEHLNRKTAEDINERVLGWLSQPRERPFFLFLNYFDAHEPYLAPPPFDATFGRRKYPRASQLHHYLWNPAVWSMTDEEIREEIAAYNGAIAYLDEQLTRLFGELQQRGLMDNLLVIITSDHGEEFGEHGLFDHGNTLYLPGIHVPLIIRFPPGAPQGHRVDTPVSIGDLPATVIDLLGITAEPAFPGASLARFWSETPPNEPMPALSEVSQGINLPDDYPVSRGDMKSLVGAEHHYILNGDGVEELYAPADDPDEQVDLAAAPEATGILSGLRDALGDLLRRDR